MNGAREAGKHPRSLLLLQRHGLVNASSEASAMDQAAYSCCNRQQSRKNDCVRVILQSKALILLITVLTNAFACI